MIQQQTGRAIFGTIVDIWGKQAETLHPYVRHQFRKLKRRLEGTETDQESQEWLKWLNKELKEYLLHLLEVVRTQMLVVSLDKEIHAACKPVEDSCTDEEGSSSEGTETNYRATAESQHAQFFEIVESSEEKRVDGEDPGGTAVLKKLSELNLEELWSD